MGGGRGGWVIEEVLGEGLDKGAGEEAFECGAEGLAQAPAAEKDRLILVAGEAGAGFADPVGDDKIEVLMFQF